MQERSTIVGLQALRPGHTSYPRGDALEGFARTRDKVLLAVGAAGQSSGFSEWTCLWGSPRECVRLAIRFVREHGARRKQDPVPEDCSLIL